MEDETGAAMPSDPDQGNGTVYIVKRLEALHVNCGIVEF